MSSSSSSDSDLFDISPSDRRKMLEQEKKAAQAACKEAKKALKQEKKSQRQKAKAAARTSQREGPEQTESGRMEMDSHSSEACPPYVDHGKLEILEGMGFVDRDLNIQMLAANDG